MLIEAWRIVAISFGYVFALFAIAWFGDRMMRSRKPGSGRPIIYAMSLGIYCTSWTYFGSVGLAATSGFEFVPIYIGPILMFVFGSRLLLRIVRLAKSQNTTSVADFMAARYGKSSTVAAVVAVVAVVGVLPYIALQLKAITAAFVAMVGANAFSTIPVPVDTALLVALALASFAVLFGTRHIDATEHQHGLMLAVAAESIVKLFAFLAVGIFITITVFGDFATMLARASSVAEVSGQFARPINPATWATIIFLSFVAIILLPRQFHVAVVENQAESDIRHARWSFPLYLILINLFVVPIAIAGLATLPSGTFAPDMFVLAVPLALEYEPVTLIAFIGGLSAAAAMVIVESVALSVMVCNGLVVPLLVRFGPASGRSDGGVTSRLLVIRRIAIFVVILLGYVFYRELGQTRGLVSIGLVSFAAIAQLAPAFFGGLYWRQASAKGAIAGIVTGFGMWTYTLLLPWCAQAGFVSADVLVHGPFGIVALVPQALFGMAAENPLTHGVAWSILTNVVAFVSVSLVSTLKSVERLQADIFAMDAPPPATAGPSFKMWRSTVLVRDIEATVASYIGVARAQRSFATYAAGQKQALGPDAEADIQLLQFAEHLLASAIGAASSRLVLSLLLRRGSVSGASARRLLDDATEALQHNRDLLQSAIDEVRHGLSVFDKDMRLICWNRQFRRLMALPSDYGRVGMPLDKILRTMAERGDFGQGDIDRLVEDRILRLADRKELYQERLIDGRIIEVRTSAMPQGGIVTTYIDITERVTAAANLARANESLERRVAERTAELMRVNAELEIAKKKADQANQDKTRFLAAASHDVLQPLNAARLYASALVERTHSSEDAQTARKIDTSLDAVEEIFSALIDIARLDTHTMEPEIAPFRLSVLFDQLRVEFEPIARERGLSLTFVPTGLAVGSDRRLLRRVLQNFVSNAIKYTTEGGVVVGARRRGGHVLVQVSDTGVGMKPEKLEHIFKEFLRLEETSATTQGLGLGLSIVERICKVLGHEIQLRSRLGHGSTFTVVLPRVEAPAIVRPFVPVVVAAQPGRIAGLTVLCVDNEAAVLDGMGTLLSGWGCHVAKAGSVALAEIQARSARVKPAVIVADYHLGDGTGLDAIAAVRAVLGAGLPAIVVTADQSAEVAHAVRASDAMIMHKPVKAAALRALLTQMARSQAAAE